MSDDMDKRLDDSLDLVVAALRGTEAARILNNDVGGGIERLRSRIAALEAELADVRTALNREAALTGSLAREKARLCERIASLRDGEGCNCAPEHMEDCPVRENGGGK